MFTGKNMCDDDDDDDDLIKKWFLTQDICQRETSPKCSNLL
jgi:hypothetical protein